MEAGYLSMAPVHPDVLQLSQTDLQRKRGAIWGRVLVMQAAGIPTPRFEGFSLFRNWLHIPIGHKFRSIIGTARRIISRRYFRPLVLDKTSGS